jgi:hypothetical protein
MVEYNFAKYDETNLNNVQVTTSEGVTHNEQPATFRETFGVTGKSPNEQAFKELYQRFLELKDSGLTDSELAVKLGRSVTTVRRMKRKLRGDI